MTVLSRADGTFFWMALGLACLFVGAAALRVARVVYRTQRTRDLARRLRAIPSDGLRPGACTLTGIVAADDPGRPVCVVHVVEARHKPRLGIAFEWEGHESSSQRRAQPFSLLIHGSQTPVRVLPDEGVRLLARADVKMTDSSPGAEQRHWLAQLHHGEHVAVSGRLVNGSPPDDAVDYRGRSVSWWLTAVEGVPVEIEAASASHEIQRSTRSPRAETAGLALALALYLAAIGSYAHNRGRSRVVLAEVTSVYSATMVGRNSASTTQLLDARYERSERGESPVFFVRVTWTHEMLQMTPVVGALVPITIVEGAPHIYNAGRTYQLALREAGAMMAAYVMLLLLATHAATTGGIPWLRRRRAWYEPVTLDTLPPRA